MPEYICLECGIKFERKHTPSQPIPLFCSHRCAANHYAKDRPVRLKFTWGICKQCDKIFIRPMKAEGEDPQMFCGHRCRVNFDKKMRRR